MGIKRKLTAADLLPAERDFIEADCPYVAPRKCGYIESEPGESGYKYAIYSRDAVESAFGVEVASDNAQEIAENLTGWCEGSGGTGRWFTQVAFVRVFERNIIVRQFCGLDI